YTSQMPHVIIGIDKWMRDNRPTVEGMLKAVFDGGDQVKNVAGALHYAAGVSSAVYQEKNSDASYWEKYFIGTNEQDKQGMRVDLGGSTVNNLADNMQILGLAPGSGNLFAGTYHRRPAAAVYGQRTDAERDQPQGMEHHLRYRQGKFYAQRQERYGPVAA